MIIFNGKTISEKILEDTKKKIREKGISPTLAIIRAGGNPEIDLYIRKKREAAYKIGVKIFCYNFPSKSKETELIDKIKELNKDILVDGIIVQLPLPSNFDTGRVIASVDPKKDVDGFHEVNRKLLRSNNPYFLPVLPLAVLNAINYSVKDIKSKEIVTLCNSGIFGDTLQNFFSKNGINSNYVLADNNPISEIRSKISSADIVISVCGRPRFIKGYMIKKGVVLIDAGIKFVKNSLAGDVDKESVSKKVSFLTPVPGGIGPLTVAFLLKNVYLAAENDLRR
jgi:methylenetetrahydrofolate dehydrogenase (NADP+) / methenyltetrahydrofolate cyclohydrolase